MKLLARLSVFCLLAASLTSCSTLFGVMNSAPVRMLDELGSAAAGMLGDAGTPDARKPASVEERARQIESRGVYAGRLPVGETARVSMASR
jgi:hypothetical protein